MTYTVFNFQRASTPGPSPMPIQLSVPVRTQKSPRRSNFLGVNMTRALTCRGICPLAEKVYYHNPRDLSSSQFPRQRFRY